MSPQAPNTPHCPEASGQRWLPLIAGLCLAVAQSGCVLLPSLGTQKHAQDVASVQSRVPEQWSASWAKGKESEARDWQSEFQTPAYRALVVEALAHNHDLAASSARIRQARAELKRAQASWMPNLGLSFLSSRTQSPGDQRFNALPPINNRFRLPFDVTWELDLWGRIADDRRAAKARWLAAEETYSSARLSLTATVLKAAITLTEAQQQLQLALVNHRSRQTQLQVLERVMERGLSAERSALDVTLGRADLQRAEATIGQRRAAADQACRALELLLGRYPSGKERGIASFPKLARPSPKAQPLTVLLQRPDLLAAQRRLESSLALKSSAAKAFLPSLNLTANAGRTAQQTQDLFTPQAAIWSIASSVSQSLFQGGRTQAGLRLSQARYDEELETYTQAVLNACNEVETALAADAYLQMQVRALEQSAIEAEKAEELAQSQYERGLIEALTLLDSQQRAFDARSAWIAVEAQRLRTRVDLHLALGGGFAPTR